jgi:hypothetical protein
VTITLTKLLGEAVGSDCPAGTLTIFVSNTVGTTYRHEDGSRSRPVVASLPPEVMDASELCETEPKQEAHIFAESVGKR